MDLMALTRHTVHKV